MSTSQRPRFISRVAGGVAAVSSVALIASACGGPDESDSTITVGAYGSGTTALATTIPTEFLAENEEIQQKNDIVIEYRDYNDLQTMYTDVTLGRVDVVIGGPATVASSAVTGAPVAVGGTVARSAAAMMSTNKTWSEEDLRGSRVVAQTSSGNRKAVQSSIQAQFGLIADIDYEVINSDSTAAAALQAATGQADYALVRAEQILIAEQQFPELKSVAENQDLGVIPGRTDWGYVLEVNTNTVDEDKANRLVAAYKEIVAYLAENPEEVEQFATERGQKPGVTKDFLTSGRVGFDVQTIADTRDDIRREFTKLHEAGAISELPPESVYKWGE